jgi:2-iminobutanoate/2-iminopropanoate deaminase
MNRRDAFLLAGALAASAGETLAKESPLATNATIHRAINATPSAYAQAQEVTGAKRFLFVSGQTPEAVDGSVAKDFREQCRQAWANVAMQLAAGSMSLDNLVKVTVFLADRRYRAENAEVRREVLGTRAPALTIIIAGIYEEAWLVEIEAVAAD